MPEERAKKISPQQARFISEYLKNGRCGAKAARAAGYIEKSCKRAAYRLLYQNPLVAAEIKKATQEIVESAKFDTKQAVAETDALIQEAREAKQYTAAVKAHETKLRLFGMLVERHQVQQVGFNLVVSGIDFAKRDGDPADEAIEVEAKEVKNEGESE